MYVSFIIYVQCEITISRKINIKFVFMTVIQNILIWKMKYFNQHGRKSKTFLLELGEHFVFYNVMKR